MRTEVREKKGHIGPDGLIGNFELWALIDDQWVIQIKIFYGAGCVLERDAAHLWVSGLDLIWQTLEYD